LIRSVEGSMPAVVRFRFGGGALGSAAVCLA
jgi:hypothetical protein